MGRCPHPIRPFPAVPAGLLLPVGPIGPCGTLSPSDSGSAMLVDSAGVFPSSDPQPGGTLLPGEEGPGVCQVFRPMIW